MSNEIVPAEQVFDAEIVKEGPGTCEAVYPGCTGLGYVQQDPFMADIYDEIVFGVWCDECVHEMAMEI